MNISKHVPWALPSNHALAQKCTLMCAHMSDVGGSRNFEAVQWFSLVLLHCFSLAVGRGAIARANRIPVAVELLTQVPGCYLNR